jgi:hypothetical protein
MGAGAAAGGGGGGIVDTGKLGNPTPNRQSMAMINAIDCRLACSLQA